MTPPYFTMEGQEGQEYQPRPWEMWEPAGGPNAERPARIVNGRMKDAGNSYVVIFKYGSVVFLHFNQSQQEVGEGRFCIFERGGSSDAWDAGVECATAGCAARADSRVRSGGGGGVFLCITISSS